MWHLFWAQGQIGQAVDSSKGLDNRIYETFTKNKVRPRIKNLNLRGRESVIKELHTARSCRMARTEIQEKYWALRCICSKREQHMVPMQRQCYQRVPLLDDQEPACTLLSLRG